MKKIFIIAIALLCCQLTTVNAQTIISPQAVSGAGGTLTGGSNMITFNIGEPVIPTLITGGSIVSEGFEQPDQANIFGGNIVVSASSSCVGASLPILFTVNGTFNSDNVFTAQLSGANGSFTSPVTIGTLTSSSSGSINATIPSNTPIGSGYRIRVISSDPAITGSDNGTDLSIGLTLNATVTNASCAGNDGAIDLTVTGGTSLTFVWSNGATDQNISGLAPGFYSVIVTGAGGCTGYDTAYVSETISSTYAWGQKAPFPGAGRVNAVAFSIGSKGYMGTGIYQSSPDQYLKDFWEYDPSTNVWTQKADFGGDGRYEAVGFSIGTTGYIGTGLSGGFPYTIYNDFWAYDPASNTWTRKADFAAHLRFAANGFSIGNKGYVTNGFDGSSLYNDLWEYDPVTDAWTQKTDFPGGLRYGVPCFSASGKGYIGGPSHDLQYNDMWAYDPASDSWTQKAAFPGQQRYNTVSFSIGDKGFVGTGQSTVGNTTFQDMWQYDPDADSWAQIADVGVGATRYGAAGFSVGVSGYIVTGGSVNGYVNDFWQYAPTLTPVVTDAICNGSGGAITLPLTWGEAPYTFAWTSGTSYSSTDQNISNLNEGLYDVTVTAAGGCSITTSAYVSQTIIGTYAWTQKANFGGVARSSAVSFSIGAKGYIGTGYYYDGSPHYLNDFWQYDPATNVWTQEADFGGAARSQAVGFSIGAMGYIGTGGTGVLPVTDYGDFWQYDPSSNTWTRKADLPGVPRMAASAFSIGAKGYIGAGVYSSNYVRLKDFWEYDPASDVWTQKTDFGGQARYFAPSFSIGDRGYIGGPSSDQLMDLWEYDQLADSWTQKASFPGTWRLVPASFSIGAKGYLAGGETGDNTAYFAETWEYDPSTDVWTQKANMGSALGATTGFSIGWKGYVGTGENGLPPTGFGNDFWQFAAPDQSTSTGGDWTANCTWNSTNEPYGSDNAQISTTGGNAVTLSAGAGVASLIVDPAAILSINDASSLAITGDATVNGTIQGVGTASFSGTTPQTIYGSATISNVIIDNPAGVTLDPDINTYNSLTFTNGSGTLNTATTLVAMPYNAPVTVSSTGWVNGTLERTGLPVSGDASTTFQVGDATSYDPAEVDLHGLSGASGSFSASTTAGKFSGIANSPIDTAKCVARSWKVSNIGTTFSTFDLTLSYNASEIPTGANADNFVIAQTDDQGTTWTIDQNGIDGSDFTEVAGLIYNSNFIVGQVNCSKVLPSLSTSVTSITPCHGNGAIALVKSGGLGSFSYHWSNGMTTDTITNLTAGSYSVTVTAVGGCTATASAIVSGPTAGSNAVLSGVCAGGSLNLTAAGGTAYSWAGPNGFTSTLQNPSISNVTSAAVGTYTVTITNGCPTSTATTTIKTINAIPVATATPSGVSLCSGSKTAIALTSNLVSTVWSYSPVVTGGTVSGDVSSTLSTIAQTLINTGTTPAVVTYSIVGTKSGCSSSHIYAAVTVNPKPSGTVSPLAVAICSGASAGITITPGAVSGTTFSWTIITVGSLTGESACASSCGTSINDVITNAGVANGVVTYNITPTANGCAGTVLKDVVTIRPVPTASTVNGSTTICNKGKTAILITGTTGGTIYTHAASAGVGITGFSNGTGASIAQTLLNSATAPSVVTYTITPTYVGCPGVSIQATVTVNPVATGTATPPANTICTGSSSGLMLNAGPVAGTSFEYISVSTSLSTNTVTGATASCTSGCGTSIADVLSNSGIVNGTATYTITPWANGCAGTVFKDVVTVRPVPVVYTTVASSYSICNGAKTNIPLKSYTSGTIFLDTASLTTIPLGGGTVSGFADGILATIAQTLANTGTSQGVVTYNCTPSYDGCLGSPIAVTATVNPVATGSASPSPVGICSGFSAGVTLNGGLVSGTKFTWVPSAVSTIGGATSCTDTSGACGTLINTVLTTTAVGAVEVYTITPYANGCAGTKFIEDVTVQSGSPVKPTITGTSTKICAGNGTSYTYTVTNLATFNSVIWTLPTGCTIVTGSLMTNPITITYPSGYVSGTLSAVAVNECGNASLGGYLATNTKGSACRISDNTTPEPTSSMNLIAYPNPAHNKLNVEFTSSATASYLIRMIDITGRIVINKVNIAEEGNNLLEFDMSDLAKGLYILSFTSGEESKQMRVVVE